MSHLPQTSQTLCWEVTVRRPVTHAHYGACPSASLRVTLVPLDPSTQSTSHLLPLLWLAGLGNGRLQALKRWHKTPVMSPVPGTFFGFSSGNGSHCLALQQSLSWGPGPQGDRPVFPAHLQAPSLLPITAPWAGFTQLRVPELLCALGYLSLRDP